MRDVHWGKVLPAPVSTFLQHGCLKQTVSGAGRGAALGAQHEGDLLVTWHCLTAVLCWLA